MLYYKEYLLSPEAEWVVFIHGAGGSSAVWFKQLKDFRKTTDAAAASDTPLPGEADFPA